MVTASTTTALAAARTGVYVANTARVASMTSKAARAGVVGLAVLAVVGIGYGIYKLIPKRETIADTTYASNTSNTTMDLSPPAS